MSDELPKAHPDRTKFPPVTIRGMLLSMVFVGCALFVWRLPWLGPDSTLSMSFISLAFLGAAVGAPFGLWWQGTIVVAGMSLVPIVLLSLL